MGVRQVTHRSESGTSTTSAVWVRELVWRTRRRSIDESARTGWRTSSSPLPTANTSGDPREAYVSTQQPSSSPQARVPCSDEHSRRPRRVEVAPQQGSRPPLGLIHRVRDRTSFDRLRREGTRVRSGPLWCVHVSDPDVMPAQVAFALGRPIGSAVTRNRLRRRLRHLLTDMPPGIALVGAHPTVVELTFDQLRMHADHLVHRCGSTRSESP